ncbi:MAG: CBS domain-containing protein [Planctomycetota bacterium]
MSVKQIVVRDVDVCDPTESVQRAAQRMHDRNVGMLVVCDQTRTPIGVLTDRDVAVRIVAEGRDPMLTTVASVMITAVASIGEDTSIEIALQSMRAAPCRRLPVVDAYGVLIGILSLDDVLNWLTGEFNDIHAVLQREGPSSLIAGG